MALHPFVSLILLPLLIAILSYTGMRINRIVLHRTQRRGIATYRSQSTPDAHTSEQSAEHVD